MDPIRLFIATMNNRLSFYCHLKFLTSLMIQYKFNCCDRSYQRSVVSVLFLHHHFLLDSLIGSCLWPASFLVTSHLFLQLKTYFILVLEYFIIEYNHFSIWWNNLYTIIISVLFFFIVSCLCLMSKIFAKINLFFFHLYSMKYLLNLYCNLISLKINIYSHIFEYCGMICTQTSLLNYYLNYWLYLSIAKVYQ